MKQSVLVQKDVLIEVVRLECSFVHSPRSREILRLIETIPLPLYFRSKKDRFYWLGCGDYGGRIFKKGLNENSICLVPLR